MTAIAVRRSFLVALVALAALFFVPQTSEAGGSCYVTRQITTCHPCTGCPVTVCVKVPACCADIPPSVFCRNTIIGCGLKRFTWCECDYSVTVRFYRHGGVTVH